jgi:mycothiol synthase
MRMTDGTRSRLAAAMPEPMRADPTVVRRPLDPDDAEAVFQVTKAAEIAESGTALVELDDIVGDWARPSFDLAAQTIGFFENDALVAYAEVHAGRGEVAVDPAHRGRGHGTALLTWVVEKARELGYPRVGQTVPVTNQAALSLFRAFGYRKLWTSWILELPAGAAITDTALPPGHRVREFEPGTEDRAVYQTIEDAFNEWPDRGPTTFEDWSARTLQRGDFEPWQVIVAVEGSGAQERVVGACKVSSMDEAGWVDQIAVRRDARGRGLGRALLVAAFRSARDHGATYLRLNTDSRTGALGLYEHVGMRVVETYEHHALELT